MAENSFEKYQKIIDKIEKQKQKSKVFEDHLKAAEYRHSRNLDYQKNGHLRRERTHRLVQKGALLEKYIEEHLTDFFPQTLKPEESEILLDVFSDILKKNKPYILKQYQNKKEKKKPT
jgi:hypothetical protein